MATIPNKMRLTKIAIAALPVPDADATVWDRELSGFGLRLLPSGARTYILQRRTKAGRSVRLKIARVGDLTADQARDEAKRLISRITLGEDPAEQRRQARQAERQRRQAPTVADLAGDWLRQGRTRRGEPWRDATREAYERAVAHHVLPALGAMKVEDGRAPARQGMPCRSGGRARSRRTGCSPRPRPCSGSRSGATTGRSSVNPASASAMNREQHRERYPQNGELGAAGRCAPASRRSRRAAAAVPAADRVPARRGAVHEMVGRRSRRRRLDEAGDADQAAAIASPAVEPGGGRDPAHRSRRSSRSRRSAGCGCRRSGSRGRRS